MDEHSLQNLNEIQSAIIRSLDIRMRISRERIEAIQTIESLGSSILEKNIREPHLKNERSYFQALEKIRFCLRNERRLMAVVEKGLEKSDDEIKKEFDLLQRSLGQTSIGIDAKKIMEALLEAKKSIKKVEKRMALEEAFLGEMQSAKKKELFLEFIQQWKAECELESELLKKATPIPNARKNLLLMREIFLMGGKDLALRSAAVGIPIGILNFALSTLTPLQIGLLLGNLIIISTIVDLIKNHNSSILLLHKREFDRLRQTSGLI